MGEKIHGNPENGVETTREEKPKRQVDPKTAQALGATAIQGSKK